MSLRRSVACVAAFSLIGFLAACSPSPLPPVQTEPPAATLPAHFRELSPDEASSLLQAKPDTVILDVRTETEFGEEGKLPGAQLYDYLHGTEMFGRLDRLDRDGSYLVYCAIGGRAKLTAAKMHEMGFKHVALLKGGLNAWIASGKAVVK